MPIRPENRHRYGPYWAAFSTHIRFARAGGRCECEGECGRGTHQGRCTNAHGSPAYGTGTTVILTVAHLCHTPECRRHVKAMCQGCHLHYDKAHHAATRRQKREEELGLVPFDLGEAIDVAIQSMSGRCGTHGDELSSQHPPEERSHHDRHD